MEYENVKFANDARESIIAGVNLATDAIQVTFGPNGRNVLINTPNGVMSTKDGKTVVTNINLSDIYAQMGVQLISEASQKMAATVGDASSTVAILTRAIIKEFQNALNPIQLFRSLSSQKDSILEYLEKNRVQVLSKDDLINAATISANNDRTIGSLVAEAYDKVGAEGIVTFEDSEGTEDKIVFSQGFRIESGFSNKGFVNTPKSTCELENVDVFISDLKMEDVKQVVSLCDKAMQNKHSLLLIAPDFDSEITVFLRSNLDVIKSCCVVAPNYRTYREVMLDDIRDILGESSFCKKVICDSKTTTFIGYTSNQEKIDEKVANIRASLESGTLVEFDKEFNTKRLANFVSGIATIYVGGFSDTERGNRMDLFEDSILATKQLLLGGYIAGGGVGIREAVDNTIGISGSGPNYANCLHIISELLNTESYNSKDLIDKGVLEPYLVTKEYLNDSLSIAGQILSCDCAILNTNLF